MKKISRRSFMAAAAVSVAALALTACGGSASSAASSVASSAASSEAVSSAAAAELTTVEAGKLTMATNATFPPYEYIEGGQVAGIDAEIITAVAEKLGLEPVIEDMEFDAVIEAVKGGKADIGLAGMTVATPPATFTPLRISRTPAWAPSTGTARLLTPCRPWCPAKWTA